MSTDPGQPDRVGTPQVNGGVADPDSVSGSSDWQTVFLEFGPKLLLFARQLTRHAAEAEDVTQEAFVRYWQSHTQDPSLTPTLMFTFVRRIAIDRARSHDRRVRREAEAQTELLEAREDQQMAGFSTFPALPATLAATSHPDPRSSRGDATLTLRTPCNQTSNSEQTIHENIPE